MKSVGVIIGRFQTPELHPGHHYLIAEVMGNHGHICILVGTRNAQPTARDPLDFETRRLMLKKHYPKATVRRLDDCATDELWSRQIDNILVETFPEMTAVLYGSRDSFLKSYNGTHACKMIREVSGISATVLRTDAGRIPQESAAFRSGVIYGTAKRFPTSYQTVDIAILHAGRQEVLLARKEYDAPLWRFVGGFVDPADETLECAAKREAQEETGKILIADIKYAGSLRVADFRYRGQSDQVMTSFFMAQYVSGDPIPTDDISELAWYPLEGVMDILVPQHKPLGEMLLRFTVQQARIALKEESHVSR